MKLKATHLSDAELLLLLSRELASRAAATAQLHLKQCESCRRRSAELNTALENLQGLQKQDAELQDPASVAQRSRLVSAMKTAKPDARRAFSARGLFPRLAFSAIAIGALLLAGRVLSNVDRPRGVPVQMWPPAALPSRVLTPGATHTVALSELCRVQGSTARVAIDDGTARKVFQEYGVAFASRSSYEVDYLITPGLGGSNDVSNLWPEPDEATTWNAHVKDVLEDHLHTLVCEGQLPLATAQSEISSDWIAAYKKHFHTDKPLRG